MRLRSSRCGRSARSPARSLFTLDEEPSESWGPLGPLGTACPPAGPGLPPVPATAAALLVALAVGAAGVEDAAGPAVSEAGVAATTTAGVTCTGISHEDRDRVRKSFVGYWLHAPRQESKHEISTGGDRSKTRHGLKAGPLHGHDGVPA